MEKLDKSSTSLLSFLALADEAEVKKMLRLLFGPKGASCLGDGIVSKIGPLLVNEVAEPGLETQAAVSVSSLTKESGALIFVVRRPG